MTGAQYRAGWRDPGEPGPVVCLGSGQLVAFVDSAPHSFGASWDVCPECGRRVQIVTRDGSPVLAEHEPPAPVNPSGRPAVDGPSFGL